MGPGTHVFDRITSESKPVSRADAIALIHDIDYLIATNSSTRTSQADKHAMSQADFDLPGVVLTAGLGIRNYLDLPFNTTAPNEAFRKVVQGEQLKEYVQNDPLWTDLLDDYDLTFTAFNQNAYSQ